MQTFAASYFQHTACLSVSYCLTDQSAAAAFSQASPVALVQYLGADRTRVYFKKYPRLQVGRRRTSAGSPRHLTTAASTDMRTKLAHQVEKDSHPDYPFSFYSQQKVSGTGRRNAHGHEVLYARVDGSSGLRPAQ